MFTSFVDEFCTHLTKEHPFLPSVIFKLFELAKKNENLGDLLKGVNIKEAKDNDFWYNLSISPLDNQYITEFNKNLLKENT